MLKISRRPPTSLWQVGRQLATPFLLNVPSPNLGACTHGGVGGSEVSCVDRDEEAEEEEEEERIRSIFTTG